MPKVLGSSTNNIDKHFVTDDGFPSGSSKSLLLAAHLSAKFHFQMLTIYKFMIAIARIAYEQAANPTCFVGIWSSSRSGV